MCLQNILALKSLNGSLLSAVIILPHREKFERMETQTNIC